jgi:ribosomal protein S18 acetylase RimI-like enzyme
VTDTLVTLRRAEPTREDGLRFAQCLDSAAEGFFRFMLGPRSTAIIANAYLEPGHDLSYQHAIFAEVEATFAGVVSGYTAEQHRVSSLRPLEASAGRQRQRMRIVTFLFAPLIRIVDSIEEGDYYLQAISVVEAFRGHGVGTALINELEESARKTGARRIVLDVSAKNSRACRFYERHGFSIESQWPKHIVIPGLRFFRMVKPV